MAIIVGNLLMKQMYVKDNSKPPLFALATLKSDVLKS